MRISSHPTSPATRRASARRGAPQAFRMLASSTRYAILRYLFAARAAKKELCVGDIAGKIRLSHSATSHQLALLEAHGIVVGVRMGQTTCYELTDSSLVKDIGRIIGIFQ